MRSESTVIKLDDLMLYRLIPISLSLQVGGGGDEGLLEGKTELESHKGNAEGNVSQ